MRRSQGQAIRRRHKISERLPLRRGRPPNVIVDEEAAQQRASFPTRWKRLTAEVKKVNEEAAQERAPANLEAEQTDRVEIDEEAPQGRAPAVEAEQTDRVTVDEEAAQGRAFLTRWRKPTAEVKKVDEEAAQERAPANLEAEQTDRVEIDEEAPQGRAPAVEAEQTAECQGRRGGGTRASLRDEVEKTDCRSQQGRRRGSTRASLLDEAEQTDRAKIDEEAAQGRAPAIDAEQQTTEAGPTGRRHKIE